MAKNTDFIHRLVNIDDYMQRLAKNAEIGKECWLFEEIGKHCNAEMFAEIGKEPQS